MSNKHAGMAHAMKEIAEQIPELLEQLPTVLEDLVWSVGVPLATGLAIAAVVGIILTKLKRLLFPPSAAELHREALQTLSSSTTSSSTKNQQRSERQAERLLGRALQRDAHYQPAVWSLAALYIYRQRNGHKAVQLLRSTTNQQKDPVVTGLLLDAQAVIAGQYQMIQSELREAEFLSLASWTAADYSTAKTTTTRNEPLLDQTKKNR